MSELTYTTPAALLNAICGAVREKDGTTDAIAYQDLPQRILDIPSGEVSNIQYLYNLGNEYSEFTGGLSIRISASNITKNDSNIIFTMPSSGHCQMYFNNVIDFTQYITLNMEVECADALNPYIGITNSNDFDWQVLKQEEVSNATKVLTINIQDNITEGRILFGCGTESYTQANKTVTIKKIWLEKKQMPSKLYLYKDGDECTDVTGGWEGFSENEGTFSKNVGNILISSIKSVYLHTSNKINISNYTTLNIKYSLISSGGYIGLRTDDVLTNKPTSDTSYVDDIWYELTNRSITTSLILTHEHNELYMIIKSQSVNLYISEVWLE